MQKNLKNIRTKNQKQDTGVVKEHENFVHEHLVNAFERVKPFITLEKTSETHYKGDSIIHIVNPEPSARTEYNIVVDAKHRKNNSRPEAHEWTKLRNDVVTNKALGGIMVVSDDDQAPAPDGNGLNFWMCGIKYIHHCILYITLFSNVDNKMSTDQDLESIVSMFIEMIQGVVDFKDMFVTPTEYTNRNKDYNTKVKEFKAALEAHPNQKVMNKLLTHPALSNISSKAPVKRGKTKLV